VKKKMAVLSLGLFLFGASAAQVVQATKTESEKAALSKESKPDAASAPAVKERIPSGSKFYVAPMGGFETYVIAGLMKKQVPVLVVNSREKADYEITGASESQKASWAKMMFMGSQQSHEEASVVIANIKTGTVVFGYNVNKGNSVRGRQSAAEACAKHIKNSIEGHEQ
jgi:hypothetical protein